MSTVPSRGITDLNEDFIDLLDVLSAHGVAFVVVGAHALAAHGVTRATGDLDVLVRADAANAERVFAALEEFGAPLRAHGIVPADFEAPGSVYQMGLPPRRIDILTRVSGPTFEEIWSTRVELDVAGHRVPCIGREAFIANKKASGRPKDLLDLALLDEHEHR